MCFILYTGGFAAAAALPSFAVSATTGGTVGGFLGGGTAGFINYRSVFGKYEEITTEITKLSVMLNKLKAKQQELHRGRELKKDQIKEITD